jgi:hypothetical protein
MSSVVAGDAGRGSLARWRPAHCLGPLVHAGEADGIRPVS